MKYRVTVQCGGGHIKQVIVEATSPDGAKAAARAIAEAEDLAARGSTYPPRTWTATYARQV